MTTNPEVQFTAFLENWVYDPTHNVYCGLIYGDSRDRFGDGTWVRTSTVMKVEGDVVTTRNSVYKLGNEQA